MIERFNYFHIILFVSSFEIIDVVILDPKSFSCIPTSAADAAVVSSSGIKSFELIA